MTKDEKLTVLNNLITQISTAKKEAETTSADLSKEIAFQQRLISRSDAVVAFTASQLTAIKSDLDLVQMGKL